MVQFTYQKSRWFILAIVLLFILTACKAPTNTDGEPVSVGSTDVTEKSTTAVPTQESLPEETPTKPDEVNSVAILTTDNRSDRLRSLTSGWGTNWALRTIDTSEILSGGPPRDGIPAIDTPQFITPAEAGDWLADNEPVIFLEVNGDARAYPLQILIWHEIVNDTVGDVPVLITFCPLCNSALVFDRRVDGDVYEFGTSGLLRNSDLIMYDRTTESLWQQFTGDAIIGDKVGAQLTFLSSALISFADFKAAHPDGRCFPAKPVLTAATARIHTSATIRLTKAPSCSPRRWMSACCR